MVENRSGTFDLEQASFNLDDRGWLSTALDRRRSIIFGNPIEGQHIRLESLGHKDGKADFKVFEKITETETHIGYCEMEENKQYLLSGTNVALSAGNFETLGERVHFGISAPAQIHVLRDNIYFDLLKEGLIEEPERIDITNTPQQSSNILTRLLALLRRY